MKKNIVLYICLLGILLNYNAYSQKSYNSILTTINNSFSNINSTDNNIDINEPVVFFNTTDELIADFLPSERNITVDDCISFEDKSVGSPIQWIWSFPGAATTSSNLQNPTNICYRTPGTYDVILEVRRNADRHTFIFKDCITVNMNPDVPIADFEADIRVVPVNGIVKFTNKSKNGPCDQWAWVFGEGASPEQSTDSIPPPVVYREPGLYSVTLRCRKTNGNQNMHTKTHYIKVVEHSNKLPVANFTSNFRVIKPGQSVNFIDMSTGNPYKWNWTLAGSNTPTSNLENPSNIVYPTAGKYDVKLSVQNNVGTHEITLSEFIVVSETDPCLENPENPIPVANFAADERLISYNGSVRFQNLSENFPNYNYWTFEGGEPYTSNEASPSTPIVYKNPGIYKVMLTSVNECGSNTIIKEKYIYVFNGDVGEYCETFSTVYAGDDTEIVPYPDENQWGYLAGHNGKKIRDYANYFDRHSFNEIQGVEIPVALLNVGEHGSNIRIRVWNGNTSVPDNDKILGEQVVYLRNLKQGQTNRIIFNYPIKVDGPFYLGYRVNYTVDPNEDGITDDLFVCKIVKRRGTSSPNENNLYVSMPGSAGWQPFVTAFGYNSALDINPIACLTTDIDPVLIGSEVNIFPNPSKGLINIMVSSENIKDFSVEIYDALGRKIFADLTNTGFDTYSVDISRQPQGLYVVRVLTDLGIINKKLLLTK
jgi:PKD repeat protein